MATACENKNFKQFITGSTFIGKGGFGEVYGPCVWKDKICAVKRRICGSMENCEKEQEACKRWMSLHHRNLITVYNVSFESPVLYMLMEYAGGGSLKIVLERCASALPVQILTDWGIQIAQGMAYLHQKNIVHRDLKSPNIIIMEPDAAFNPYGKTLKIIDFDQIREHYHTTVMSGVGAFAWTAPEVLESAHFSKASDVWSYGVILWEMLTREVPYKDYGSMSIIFSVVTEGCKLTVPDICPAHIKTVLESCLQYERSERPKFDDVVSDLQYPQHGHRIQTKYNQLVSNLSCLGDIIAAMYEKEKLTLKELEQIQHLLSTPMRANEELLSIIAKKPRDVYECFLSLIKDTNQLHLYQMLVSVDDTCDKGKGEDDSNHKDLIRRHFIWLSEKLDIENGLIFLLHQQNVLTVREREYIFSMSDTFQKNELLLGLLSRKSPKDFENFIKALEVSGQGHLAKRLRKPEESQRRKMSKEEAVAVSKESLVNTNIKSVNEMEEETYPENKDILDKGIKPMDKAIKESKQFLKDVSDLDDRQMDKPSALSTMIDRTRFFFNEFLNMKNEVVIAAEVTNKSLIDEAIYRHRNFLEEHMDPDSGILENLLSRGTFSFREVSEIKDKSPLYRRNSEMLHYILKKHQGNSFTVALQETEQMHIVNYLNGNGDYNPKYGNEWPLTATEMSILDINQKRLIDLLDLSGDLLVSLFASKVINMRQMDFISSKLTSYEKAEALLDILRRCSSGNYQQTICCLHQSHQSYLAEILENNGADDGLCKQLEEQETATYGKSSSIELKDEVNKAANEVETIKRHKELLEERIDPDSGLLDILLANGSLSRKQVSEVKDKSPFYKRNSQFLDYILKKRQGNRLIDALQYTEQQHVVNYLMANGEYNPEYGEEWPLTTKQISILDISHKRLIDLLDFSGDLLVSLFASKVINMRQMEFISSKLTSYEKAEALLDILRRRSIYDYQQTLICLRQSDQSHIAEILENGGDDHLQGFNLPTRFKFSPSFCHAIKTEATKIKGSAITGLTVLAAELFIVSESSSEAEVYHATEFTFIRRWGIGVADPDGIDSCRNNNCLYIVGWKLFGSLRKILRVDARGKVIIKWPVAESWGYLSVASDSNVILTIQEERKFIEYSPNGQLIRQIELLSDAGLSKFGKLWHSVKLTNGNFMVCCGLGYNDLHGVLIVDANGHVQKSFGGGEDFGITRLAEPVYLVVDKDGFILVADRKNRRVLLFNSNLEFQKEILNQENNGLLFPSTLYLDESTSLLYVVENYRNENGGQVLVFLLA